MITIEGRLTGDSVRSAESACAEALSTDLPVTVFLREVLEIDVRGRAFLEALLRTRSRVRALGIYSRYVVKTLREGVKSRCG
jgi:mitochondrial fission protein ELM1